MGFEQMLLSRMMNSPQIRSNPMAQNAMNMLKNGDSSGLQNMAENLCRESGTTPDEIKQQLIRQFGMK